MILGQMAANKKSHYQPFKTGFGNKHSRFSYKKPLIQILCEKIKFKVEKDFDIENS